MSILKNLYLTIAPLLLIGCSGDIDVTGTYSTEVSQAGGKETIVGELNLQPQGNFLATFGQLQMAGTWKSGNGQVYLSGSDEVCNLLPSHYRADGSKLIAIHEGVDSKSWQFKRKTSQPVANR